MKRSALAFAHGARHRAAARRRALRQLSLQPLQHQHGTPDRRRCSTRSSTPSLRILAAKGRAGRPKRHDRQLPTMTQNAAARSGIARRRSTRASSSRSLPHRPGVYRMFDAAGETLYVGKARDLKKRVSSYFQKGAHETRIAVMLSQVARVETTVTRSEGEALLLENNFIKAEEPRYNILFRDDKSYPYVCLTGETFPQLRFHRGKLDRAHRYFGPFPSAGAVREGMALLQKVFQLRTCENTVFANRSRPCMLHQIAALQRALRRPRRAKPTTPTTCRARCSSCRARRPRCWRSSRRRWTTASAELAFERAARIRDKITRLTQLQSRQFVESATAGDIDVVAAAAEQGLVAVNVVMVRGGRHVGDRTLVSAARGRARARRGRAGLSRAALCRAARAADDHRRGRRGRRGACRGAVGAGGTARADRRQSRRRAPRVARDGDAECRVRDPAEARAESHAGGPARRAAEGARAAGRSAADRVLRRLAHDGRARGRLLRDLRSARDAVVGVPAVQCRRRPRAATTTRRCARRSRAAARGSSPASFRCPDLLVVDGGKGQVAVAATCWRSRDCTPRG